MTPHSRSQLSQQQTPNEKTTCLYRKKNPSPITFHSRRHAQYHVSRRGRRVQFYAIHSAADDLFFPSFPGNNERARRFPLCLLQWAAEFACCTNHRACLQRREKKKEKSRDFTRAYRGDNGALRRPLRWGSFRFGELLWRWRGLDFWLCIGWWDEDVSGTYEVIMGYWGGKV